MNISDELILEHGRRFASKYKHSWDGHFGHSYEFHPHTLIEFVKSLVNHPIEQVELTDEEIAASYELTMLQNLRPQDRPAVIKVCRAVIAAHEAKKGASK